MPPKRASKASEKPASNLQESQYAWWKFALVGVVVAGFVALALHQQFKKPVKPPVFNRRFWWGPGEQPTRRDELDESIRPFSINVKQEVLDDLKTRLKLNDRFTKPLEGVGFNYGFNHDYLKEIRTYWLEKFDWRAQEAILNKYPQYKTNIQGMNIHFQWIKSSSAGEPKREVLPILLLHGWPGSYFEFYKFIPKLIATFADNPDFTIEIVVPSLPGYGFSDPAAKPGLGVAEMSVVMANLMKRLGYEKFYIQGGDWGAAITNILATLHPESVMGAHVNMAIVPSQKNTIWWVLLGSFLPESWITSPDQAFMLFPVKDKLMLFIREMGYMHLQATKPDTIGVALSNDPIGLAAYILEKFSSWTNLSNINATDGGLRPGQKSAKFTYDEMLTNVMIYWINNCITSSMRLYSESFNVKELGLQIDEIPSDVPYGAAVFPAELFAHPENFIKDKFKNVVSYAVMPRGGHFAAFEEPELLANHFSEFLLLVEAKKLQ